MITKSELLAATSLSDVATDLTDSVLMADVECYPTFYCVSFYCPKRDKTVSLVQTPDQPIDRQRLYALMTRNTIVTFNGNRYDVPMIFYAIKGATNTQLKRASDYIITENVMPWTFAKEHGFRIPDLDHIDIIDVAPGKVGLKLYGARLHSPKLQELPYPIDAILTPEQIAEVLRYNINDLHVTYVLYLTLIEQIRLRESMRHMAGVDLRSKKDAQVASAVLKYELEKRDGTAPERPIIPPGTKFKYDGPADSSVLVFQTDEMKSVLRDVQEAEFVVPASGKLMLPPALEGRDVRIGDGVYRMGIGGLHSQEKSVSHVADEDTIVVDRDFASYYPNMMLNFKWKPRHLSDTFFDVLGGIVRTRLKAKADGDEVVANSLKIVINSTFGLTGSKYSFLYDPKIMIQVTLTGQLILLRMIERAHMAGINVISANTDGVVVKIHPDELETWNEIIADVERDTGIMTEETRYDALYSRDVNNYIAVKPGGKVKTKGAYASTGPQKNPVYEICVKAVVEHIVKGTPIKDTIYACNDVRQFIAVRTVQGGAVYGENEDDYLGKVVRWYLAKNCDGFIRTKKRDDRTGNWKTVAKTTGSKPLMDIPIGEFPDDIDYDAYIREAEEILLDIDFHHRPDPIRPIRLFKYNAMAWFAIAAA